MLCRDRGNRDFPPLYRNVVQGLFVVIGILLTLIGFLHGLQHQEIELPFQKHGDF